MIALALALTLAAQALSAQRGAEPASPSWLKTIKPMDWTLFTADQSATTLVFGRPARGNLDGQAPRIWIRIETLKQLPRSIVSLTQFDCRQRRYVVVQTSGWTGNNMEGEPAATEPLGEPTWTPIATGSLYDAVLKRFCSAD